MTFSALSQKDIHVNLQAKYKGLRAHMSVRDHPGLTIQLINI